MTFMDRIEQALASIALAAFTAAGSGAIWLIRLIFTSKKQIELLQREIEVRDERRDEDREALNEVRKDVREIRTRILGE
ncbi:hypothetical protein [Roseovarius pacificus]|uniref:hypothetical protein n=1 Tax=Roseovarius pacificus TaxID=337701 RepID=UPI002A18C3AF|nr:hypothetical protein [Roseovarius pacificus]